MKLLGYLQLFFTRRQRLIKQIEIQHARIEQEEMARKSATNDRDRMVRDWDELCAERNYFQAKYNEASTEVTKLSHKLRDVYAHSSGEQLQEALRQAIFLRVLSDNPINVSVKFED